MKKTEAELKEIVRNKYASIAKNPSHGGCCESDGCCDDATAKGLEYSFIGDEYTDKEGYMAEADLGLGCGLPTEFAKILPGQTVVDLGSGAGNDCFIARAETGPSGKVIGVDFTQEMISKARHNADKLGFDNVIFHLGEIDQNPLPNHAADVVVSNCVFNLIPNRKKAFEETYRIIKPGGHFSISDVVVSGAIPEKLRNDAALYAGCVTGAMDKQDYLQLIDDAGFSNITVQKEKVITVPEEVLNQHLDEESRALWGQSKLGVFSITVYAEKAEEKDCCNDACCN